MAKELPYFKFFPAEWLNNSITLENYNVQGVFINICALYWFNDCSITKAMLKKRLRIENEIEILIKVGIIKEKKNEKISINFLDEQYLELLENHTKRVLAGRKGGLSNAKAMPKHIDKIRKDKDKIRNKTFNPPQLQEVIEYFNLNNYTTSSANKFYNYYSVGDWIDSKGNKIRNWKQKAQSVWFKPENENPKSKLESLN